MRKVILLSLILLNAGFATHSFAKPAEQPLDQLVAVVNDDVITRSELTHAIGNVKLQIAQENATAPSDTILRKQVLEQLINKKIQLQMAHQAGLQISDTDLNNAVKHIADQNHMDTQTLYDHIKQGGMSTAEYRGELRDQMMMQKLQQQEVAGKMTISSQEVTAFLRSQAWQSNSTKEYRIEDILIPVSDAPTPEELAKAKSRSEMVLAKLHQGQNFHTVAQAESGEKNALQGGDLGWRKLPEIPTAFTERVSHMNKNDIAGPIQTPNGFHIIRVADLRTDATKKAMPDRHQIEALLLQQKFEEAVQNWVSKLRSQAYIVTEDIATHQQKAYA